MMTPDRAGWPAAPRRSAAGQALRWSGFAIALIAMVAGIANLVFAPWGNDPDGLLFGTRGIGYVGNRPYTFRDLDPMSRYYFSGGSAVLVAGAAVLAATAGARARWSRAIAAVLAVMIVGLFLLAAAGSYVSANDPFYDTVRSDLLIAAAVLVGLIIVVAAATTALLFGLSTIHGGVAVAALLALAVLHVWSMSALVHYPASEVRLTVLAWTPAAWYLLGAVGALLATVGAALRRGIPVRAQPGQPSWPAGTPLPGRQ